ncbi:vps901 [Candida metapsilosis]|uniref:Vps901 n=1 Tax=Candida metapsilosis TaxID=273372 RepID=A0A8H7ZH23_9ASCO|nr:vps901 [Candida metapsilosis]
MSFNNLAFNVSKSTPTTSTSNTNTTFSKATPSSSKGNSTESTTVQSSSSSDGRNELSGVSASTEGSSSQHKLPFAKPLPSLPTTSNSDSETHKVEHLPYKGSPSSSKLGFSPTLTAPAVVTIDNKTNDVQTNDVQTKGNSKTDLIGLFDKFDIKGERTPHSGVTNTSKHSDDLISLDTEEAASENRTIDEKADTTENKLEKMESDDGDTTKGSLSSSEREKPKLTVEKINNTAHLLMTIQPYIPPDDSSSSATAGTEIHEGEDHTPEKAVSSSSGDNPESITTIVDESRQPDEKEKTHADQNSSELSTEISPGEHTLEVSTATAEQHNVQLHSDVDSRDSQSTHFEEGNADKDKTIHEAASYTSSTSQAPSAATSPSKTPLGDITGNESEYKGIDDIKIDTKDLETSQPDSPIGKTHLNIKYKVNPTEQHQESHKAFDFQIFLLQIRKKSADPIVRYLRSFLGSYIKQVNTFSAEQRISIIEDFKSFIHEKFKLYEPFASMDSIDLENSREGLEKLLMNRLYDLCFPPEVLKTASPINIPGPYTEDLIQDKKFSTQLEKYSWINGWHFDIDMAHLSSVSFKDGQDFLDFATTELNKINNYRAPRDKIICILNSCKIIFSYLKISHKETNADSFIPLLILVIIKAKTDHLISNIHYIQSFRSKEWLLHGETSYYLSSIEGAISFIQNMTKDDLTITGEEYNAHMEAWEAQIRLKEKQEKEEMEKLQKLELKQKELREQRDDDEYRPPTPKRKLSQPQPYHVRAGSLENGEPTQSGSNLSPSNVLFSSAELLTKSISQFLSPSPQNTNGHDNSNRGTDELSPVNSPPPPALPPRKSSRAVPLAPVNESRGNTQYQPEAPTEDEIDSEQMKAAYDILKDVFPTLDTNILKDIIFLHKGNVDVCIDACLPLVEDE